MSATALARGWRLTYESGTYRSQARGKLMVLRIAQALYDDEWLTEAEFDPDANTDQVIANLDTYRAHGVLSIAVSLQGGNPGYKEEVNGIARRNGQKYGESGGLLVSAFEPDGDAQAALARPPGSPYPGGGRTRHGDLPHVFLPGAG